MVLFSIINKIRPSIGEPYFCIYILTLVFAALLFAPGVEDGAEDEGEVGLLLICAAAGESNWHAGADDRAAGDGVSVDEPALHQGVCRGQVRGYDAVEAAAGPGAVVILQTRGLFAEDEVVGDGAPELAVREGALLLLGHQALCLYRVLHVEGDLLHQAQQGQLRVLVAEGL